MKILKVKRLLLIMFALMVSFALAGCGSDTESEKATPEDVPAATDAMPEGEPAATDTIPEDEPAATDTMPEDVPAPTSAIPEAEPAPAAAIPGDEPAATDAIPEGEPSATIDMKKWQIGAIVGVGGGSGNLHFQGTSYPLSIGGIRVGAIVGIAQADLTGDVYNLTNPDDIEGTYVAAQSAVTIGGGKKAWAMKNNKGVIIALTGTQIGVEIALDVGGMVISLK